VLAIIEVASSTPSTTHDKRRQCVTARRIISCQVDKKLVNFNFNFMKLY